MEPVHKTINKRHSLVKRLLKWTGIVFLVLITILLALPYFLENRIKQTILMEANQFLDADLSIGDFKLKFLSVFPSVVVEMSDCKLSGRNEFSGVDLLDIGYVSASVNFRSMFSQTIRVDEFFVRDAIFDVRIAENGRANYGILLPDSLRNRDFQTTQIEMNIQNFSIENANLNFLDEQSDFRAILTQVNQLVRVNGDQQESRVAMSTIVESATILSGGVPYFLGLRLDASYEILLENTNSRSRATLLSNELKLNNFKTSYNGWFEWTNDTFFIDINMDASKSNFADLLSLLPIYFNNGYKSLMANGSFEMNAYLKGNLTAARFPDFFFELLVQDGFFTFPDMSDGFRNINIGLIANKLEDSTMLDIRQFELDFLDNKIAADFCVKSFKEESTVQSHIFANLDFNLLKRVVPMLSKQSIKGKLYTDMYLQGPLEALVSERYDEIETRGFFKLFDFQYYSVRQGKFITRQNINASGNSRTLSLLMHWFSVEGA
jgi:hypothetical protein